MQRGHGSCGRAGAWTQELSLRFHMLTHCDLDPSWSLALLSNAFPVSPPCSGKRSRLRAGSRWIVLAGHVTDYFKIWDLFFMPRSFLGRAEAEGEPGEVGAADVSPGMSLTSSHHEGWRLRGRRHAGLSLSLHFLLHQGTGLLPIRGVCKSAWRPIDWRCVTLPHPVQWWQCSANAQWDNTLQILETGQCPSPQSHGDLLVSLQTKNPRTPFPVLWDSLTGNVSWC